MAGWSALADEGSSLSRCEKKRSVESVIGEKHENFMGENGSLSRPLPPLLGNGKVVDLLKLFVHVKKRGGYDVVSREGLWEKVGEDQGLSCSGLGSAVKLVYYKYLRGLERDLMNVSGSVGFEGVDMDFVGLKADLKAFASTVLDGGKKNDAESEEGSTDGGKLGGVKMDSENENVEGVDVDSASSGLSGNQKSWVGANLFTEEKSRRFSEGNEEGSGQKRKRESLSSMLHWIAFVAQDPTDPVIGSLPESSKWNCYANDHCWKQVLLARKALFLKKPEGLSPEQFDFQKKQRMHPSMYDDSSTSAGRSRASRRLLSPSSLTRNCSFSYENATIFQKRIPIGQFFQAEVPKWNGKTTESDPKWLGTTICVPKESAPVFLNTKREPCFCQFPGSTGCVKLHVSRTRMKLRAELGITFYRWKFDKMGEEAALYWTAKDEEKFEAVVKDNPLSLGKCFWDELPKALPTKSREELVSYYYNVFLLRRRAHQNRYRPSDIDSDDDETEFIAKSNSFILSPGKTNAR